MDPFFKSLSLECPLYILYTSLMPDTWLANIFSQLNTFSFYQLYMVYFTDQKFLIFVRLNLLNFLFMDCATGIKCKNSLSKDFLFFPNNFIILHVTFKCIIYYKLIYIKGMRFRLRFFVCLFLSIASC